MLESEKNAEQWRPRPGDIVRVREGFDRSFEGGAYARAEREAGIRTPREGRLYEIVDWSEEGGERRAHLREVTVIHVAGRRIVTPVAHGDLPQWMLLGDFELDKKLSKYRD
jgi:hypothetical protein